MKKLYPETVHKDGKDSDPVLRLLLVDDSLLQRKIIAAHLKNSKFDIVQASSALEALEICRNEPIDLVLSDWVMPGMSGLEFCVEFRKLNQERYGYFILLTSKSGKEDIVKGLDMGADDFLSKPVNALELRARVRAGQRVIEMEAALQVQNQQINDAFGEIRSINEELTKDLVQAEKLQISLLPDSFIRREIYSISSIFQSSGHVGGDMLGTFRISEDRIALYSLDVSGHGVSSALLTVQLHGLLAPYSKNNNLAFEPDGNGNFNVISPSALAKKLNDHMIQQMDTELYFTLAYADINLKTGLVKMVQAGHPYPVFINSTKEVLRKGSGGPPIGLIPNIEFETFEFQIGSKDKLLLYSDGLTESHNKDGEILDDKGLEDILNRHKKSHGIELLKDIQWELVEYVGAQQFEDDVSAILFEFY